MGEERATILRMLAEGKITVEEAEQLLDALEGPPEKESAEEKKTEHTSFRNMAGFGDIFGDMFGEQGPFGKGGVFGKEGPFGEFFGPKCRTGKTGRNSAERSAEHEETEEAQR